MDIKDINKTEAIILFINQNGIDTFRSKQGFHCDKNDISKVRALFILHDIQYEENTSNPCYVIYTIYNTKLLFDSQGQYQ